MKYNSTQIIPAIVFIGWLDGNKLPNAVGCAAIVGQSVNIFTLVHEIQFCGNPSCSCKSAKVNGAFSDNASLKFFSPCKLPFNVLRNIAFVISDPAGNSFLLGSKEHPCAAIDCEFSSGSPDGEPAGFAYEVVHYSYKSLVPCNLFNCS